MQKDLLLHGSIPIIYGKTLWSFWRNTGEWNGCERVIFTQTRIGPIAGKGHCVEYARIFLHEKQANRPDGLIDCFLWIWKRSAISNSRKDVDKTQHPSDMILNISIYILYFFCAGKVKYNRECRKVIIWFERKTEIELSCENFRSSHPLAHLAEGISHCSV